MIKRGYVKTNEGLYYVQAPDNNEWGFTLYSDDQSWPGGFGLGEWTLVPVDLVPNDVKALLGDPEDY